ncbi:hypothetical protein COV20_05130 [Candidatus Woesearchaeota archaeon CG10_big_fil_rev_8_21_14_0_10_45_16]|nr:MAG: hypothetical protein COV20_05130 [Candidatus Woesearchaeota archaeon CG10_big_fil_rev_8_21_14_0_10_45_16]
MIDGYKKYAPAVLRLGLGLLFFWFGISQLLDQSLFLGYLPGFVFNFPVTPEHFIIINGIFDTILGLLLVLGLYTRIVAAFAIVHLLSIALGLGYNDIAVRDIGLALASLSLFLQGPDAWTLDHKRQ